MNKHPIFNNTHYKKLRPAERDALFRFALHEMFDGWNHEEQLDGLGCTIGFKNHNLSFKRFGKFVTAKLQTEKIALSADGPESLTIPARNAKKHVMRELTGFCKMHLYECFTRLKAEKEVKTIPEMVEEPQTIEPIVVVEKNIVEKSIKMAMAEILREEASEWE
jgi:hypothetical protein